jgi:hypothetical protein
MCPALTYPDLMSTTDIERIRVVAENRVRSFALYHGRIVEAEC